MRVLIFTVTGSLLVLVFFGSVVIPIFCAIFAEDFLCPKIDRYSFYETQHTFVKTFLKVGNKFWEKNHQVSFAYNMRLLKILTRIFKILLLQICVFSKSKISLDRLFFDFNKKKKKL